MVEIIIKKSSKDGKKYDAVIDGKKTVSFGATGYSDFTKHKDEDRKKNYIARHKPNQDWTGSYNCRILGQKYSLE